ncbi:MAG: cell division protein FtsA [Acidobacteria bacterium]|nr:cell division protein FtsA [Acidobacteriota bacterium]
MRKKNRIVCGLDVGTTKICMMIARAHADGSLELLGTGYANSSGLKKGIVVDLEQAGASIKKAAEEAESAANISVERAFVGAAGDHFDSFNSHGAVTIEGNNQEVTAEDMAQVIQVAKSVSIAPDREIIHVLPQEFFLDDHGGILNPVGLTGSRLDVNIHVVTCESALNQNLINAVNRAHMRVEKVYLQQLASAEAVLTRDERELGTVVIDIGGGTTDIAVFMRDAVQFTSVLPVGGAHFTRDLAIGLQTSMEDAEHIKKEYGTVLTDRIAEDESTRVPGIGTHADHPVSRKLVCEILRARGMELLELVKEQVWRAKENERLIAGIVLTGGGSMLDGMWELTEEILEMPVRQGVPLGVQGLTHDLSHPVYATAIGLAKFAAEETGLSKKSPNKSGNSHWFFNRILSWVGN